MRARSFRPHLESLDERITPSLTQCGTYPVGNSPQAVVTADFDNDGRLDLATADLGSGIVSVLLGNGDGTFQPASQFAAFSPKYLAVGDFDGDGNADLVTLCTQYYTESVFGRLEVLQGNGDGTFQAAREVAIPKPPVLPDNQYMLTLISYAPVGVRVTDVNADGRSDLGVNASYSFAEYGTGAIGWGDYFVVLLGGSDGTFQEGAGGPEDFPPPADPDLNGDGLGDMVAAAQTGVSVRLGQTDGSFSAPLLYPTGLNPRGVAVGDFNGDGQSDVAVANAGSHDVSVLLNDGIWDGTPPPPPPPAPSLTISDVSQSEGQSGTTLFTFLVTLSEPSGVPVTVAYATADGTATAGSDYLAAGDTLTFAPNETTKSISVLVYGDELFEPNETFTLNLSNPSGALIADGTGIGTIVNDDSSLPRISISDVSKVEGRNGNTFFVFTVTLSAPSTTQVKVSYATADGTARSGEDYEAATGTLTFAPGQTTKTITIKVKGDKKHEANETFNLDLFNLSSNALFTKNRGLGTILNDD